MKSYTLDEKISINKGEFVFTFEVANSSNNLELKLQAFDTTKTDNNITLKISNTSSQQADAGFFVNGKTVFVDFKKITSEQNKFTSKPIAFFKNREYLKVVKKDEIYEIYRKINEYNRKEIENTFNKDTKHFVDNSGDTYVKTDLYAVTKIAPNIYRVSRTFKTTPLFYYWGINNRIEYESDIEYDSDNVLNFNNISHIRFIINKNAKSISIWQKLKDLNYFSKIKTFIFGNADYERRHGNQICS